VREFDSVTYIGKLIFLPKGDCKYLALDCYAVYLLRIKTFSVSFATYLTDIPVLKVSLLYDN